MIALGLAALYIGNFIGASIGHSMSSEIIWTFITALIMQAVYVLYVATILPESLGAEKRQEPKKQPLAVQSEKTGNELAKTVGRILIPVAVFLPIRVGHGDITIQRPGSKWDSNVFLLSVAFGVGAMMMDVSALDQKRDIRNVDSVESLIIRELISLVIPQFGRLTRAMTMHTGSSPDTEHIRGSGIHWFVDW